MTYNVAAGWTGEAARTLTSVNCQLRERAQSSGDSGDSGHDQEDGILQGEMAGLS